MSKQEPDYYRYCPGEEAIKLSNAVCLGRRRANFRKCPGCQFNDDEQGRPSFEATVVGPRAAPTQDQPDMIEKVFKAYDVRATVPEPLNEDVAWRIGNATAQFLRTSLSGYDRSDPQLNTLIVGRDIRKHSPSLQRAFMEGAASIGTRLVDIGLIDTSQLYFATSHMPCCGGVQTTASHNPANYNGFKICGQKGRPIGAESGLKEIERIARAIARHRVPEFDTLVTRQDLSEPYRAMLHRFLREPRPMRVVVDASNGCAGRWFPILFAGVPGLTVIPLNFEHDGDFVHPPNPLVEANLAQLRAAVREHGADFGACFDGDADRCIFVDENAQVIRCDLLTALLAGEYLRERPGAAVVFDLRSSRVVRDTVARLGGRPRRERVGHVFMKRTMAELDAVVGGELSGHFYFRDYYYCDSGFMTFIAVLNVMTRTRQPLSALLAPLDVYFGSGERNFECEDKAAALRRVEERFADGRIDHLDGVTVEYDDWWLNVRPSNTEPVLRLNLEAGSAEQLREKLALVAPLLGKPVDH